jgi:rubrerythrin
LTAYVKVERRINQRPCPECGFRVSIDGLDEDCPRCGALIPYYERS